LSLLRVFGHWPFISLWPRSDISQVREKINALHARRAEIASAIAFLFRAASALRARRSGIAPTLIGDNADETAVADTAVAASGGGGVTFASVNRSLVQVRRLRKQFDRRWGFARDSTFGKTREVCVCVCVYVCVCVCLPHFCSTSSF
jgi:hypothetical protein